MVYKEKKIKPLQYMPKAELSSAIDTESKKFQQDSWPPHTPLKKKKVGGGEAYPETPNI